MCCKDNPLLTSSQHRYQLCLHSLSHCFNPESSSVPLDNPPLSLSVMSALSSSCLSVHPQINSHSLFLSLWCFFAFRPHPTHICLPNNFHVLLLFSIITLSPSVSPPSPSRIGITSTGFSWLLISGVFN